MKRRKEDKKQEREKDRECRRPKSEKRVEKSPARVEGYGGFFLRPEGLCEIDEWDGVMWNNKKKKDRKNSKEMGENIEHGEDGCM